MVSDVQFGWQTRLQSGLEACSQHKYDDAKEHFSNALDLAHQESAPEHAIGEIFFNIAWCHQALGEYPAAEQRYKQALGTVERCYGVGSEAAVKVLNQISGMYRSANRIEEADAYAMRARSPQMNTGIEGAPQAAATQPSQVAQQNQQVAQQNHVVPENQASQQNQASQHNQVVQQDLQRKPEGVKPSSVNGGSQPSPRPNEVKPPRAGIVMDGLPVATKQSGFVAGSMFKNKSDLPSASPAEASEQPVAAPIDQTPVVGKQLQTPSTSPGSVPVYPSNPSKIEPVVQSHHEQEAPVAVAVPTKRKLPRSLATATGADTDLEYDEIVSGSGDSQGPFVIEDLVHPKEKIYRRISGAVGCWIYFCSIIFWGIGFVIAPLAALYSFIAQGLYLGNLRGSGIRVSNRQFPEVQANLEKYCTVLRMEVPEVLVVNHDGLLNAFAQRLHRKDIVVICSDVLELAYEHGEKELAFVVVHELAHLKLGHLKWNWLHIPGNLVPFLGTAYSRACEYSCDRIARHLVPDGALFGLVSLAAGTKLYRNVNLTALYEQAEQDWGFWTWFSEIQSTHPNLLNRIRAIGIKDAEVKRRMRNRGQE